MTSLVLSALFLTLGGTGDAAAKPNCSLVVLRSTIDSLAKVRAEEVLYVEDGAGDGTVLRSKDETATLVSKLTRCPEELGPLLIDRLDSRKLTSFKTETALTGPHGRAVTLGFVCLDLLLQIVVPQEELFDEDCADDGLGACVNPPYYFRPDESDLVAVSATKRAWQRLLRAGRLRFQGPAL